MFVWVKIGRKKTEGSSAGRLFRNSPDRDSTTGKFFGYSCARCCTAKNIVSVERVRTELKSRPKTTGNNAKIWEIPRVLVNITELAKRSCLSVWSEIIQSVYTTVECPPFFRAVGIRRVANISAEYIKGKLRPYRRTVFGHVDKWAVKPDVSLFCFSAIRDNTVIFTR